jgi:hypothetical protein
LEHVRVATYALVGLLILLNIIGFEMGFSQETGRSTYGLRWHDGGLAARLELLERFGRRAAKGKRCHATAVDMGWVRGIG